MRTLSLLALVLTGLSLPAVAHEPARTDIWTNPDCVRGTCFCLFHLRDGSNSAPLAVISGGKSTVVVSTLPKTTVVFQEFQPLKPITPTVVFQEVRPLKSNDPCACATCRGEAQYVIEHSHKRGLFGPKAVTKVYSFEK